MSILITGIAGALAQRVAERLFAQGEDVVGVDYRPIPPLGGTLAQVRTYQASYNKTAIEDVFRSDDGGDPPIEPELALAGAAVHWVEGLKEKTMVGHQGLEP